MLVGPFVSYAEGGKVGDDLAREERAEPLKAIRAVHVSRAVRLARMRSLLSPMAWTRAQIDLTLFWPMAPGIT